MENKKVQKPDYSDNNWNALIQDRVKKWDEMWNELKKEGVQILPLWKNEKDMKGYQDSFQQPVPRLALYPIQKKKKGIVVICAGGGISVQICQ